MVTTDPISFKSEIVSTLSALSATLATVEELLLISNISTLILPLSLIGSLPWRRLLKTFCDVKILRVQGNILPDVAKFLQQDDRGSL